MEVTTVSVRVESISVCRSVLVPVLGGLHLREASDPKRGQFERGWSCDCARPHADTARFLLSPAFTRGYARVQLVEFSALGGVRVQYSFAPGAVHETRSRGGFGIGNVRHLVKLGSLIDTTLEGEYNVSLA